MSLSIGIVGLPNVGKSTLFNALLKKQTALVANYPFATIEPNIGIVGVPDERVKELSNLVKLEEGKDPEKIIPAVVKFVDIAGLVKGASQGEGLGNKFLSHIREVDALVHVIRVFEDDNVVRAGSVSPDLDEEIVTTELILADLAVLDKRFTQEERLSHNNKESAEKVKVYQKLLECLNSGKLPSSLALDEKELDLAKELQLITMKPVLYVYNISEEAFLNQQGEKCPNNILSEKPNSVCICAKLESELASFSDEEAQIYMQESGIKESGLDKIIRKSYEVLGLQTFFTYGLKEVHAWTITKGSTAPQAAGKIHSDFERGFIAVQAISVENLVKIGGWKKAREKGLIRSEGKGYIMQEGDVVEFKFSV